VVKLAEGLEGYDKEVIRLLENRGIKLFDKVRIRHRQGIAFEGIILPRPQVGDPRSLILKLDNGYNVGIKVENIEKIEVIEKSEPSPLVRVRQPKLKPGLPYVHFVGTGGTIASRIDYKTGAVYPFFTAEEIYSMLPELEDIAFVRAETLLNIFSEDMRLRLWEKIAKKVAEIFEKEKPVGVIVAHGTDTMGYTAAALGFALRRLPGPVILVGAQRSSDRPSSDSALNVIAATITAIKAPFAESVVVMHGSKSDNYCLVHRGVKVRKTHTSRRDAFRSINDLPLAIVNSKGSFKILNNRFLRRSEEGSIVEAKFDEKVALIKYFPGMEGEIIDFLVDKGYHGIVIEGTGLGHVGHQLLKSIKRALGEGIAVVMTSQCIWGRVNMNVYRRGIELLRMGVIPGEDMLPETAYVKLSWVLAKTRDIKEVRRLMLTNMVFEINERSENRFYPSLVNGEAIEN